MKLKSNYILSGMDSDQTVAVPLDGEGGFHGLIRLNESGAEVFRGLSEGENEEQLAQRLMNKYEGLDKETADKAVAAVIRKLQEAGLLEE